MKRISTFVIFLVSAVTLSASQPDARTLLHDAATRYRDAKFFRIEFETTITTSSLYSHGWSKQIYVVAAADPKYHWEQKGSGLAGVRITDGQSDWFYHPSAHSYSVQSADSTKPRSQARGAAAGNTEDWVKSSIHSLLHLDEDAESAVMQRDAVLKINRAKIPCFVVHSVRSLSFREGTNSNRDNTYWIEKATGLVRKAVLSTDGPVSAEDYELDKARTVEITYTSVDLETMPDASLFEFKPPAGAYLIDDARRPTSPPVSVGSVAPELKLTDQSGGFDLADLKGKVILVNFWASWCGACLEEMKTIAQLPTSYLHRGLVVVSVDEDETPERGDKYFSTFKFPWRNLHDSGEAHRRSWGVTAYPVLVLVDRDGKVAWNDAGAGANFAQTLFSQLDRPELRLKP